MTGEGPRPDPAAGAEDATTSKPAGAAAGPFAADTQAILSAAATFVVHKAENGITVGLWFGPNAQGRTAYGEGRSPEGNPDEAVREAWFRVRQTAGF